MAGSVLVVSAHRIVRTGLRTLFQEDGRYKKVLEASGVDEAMRIATREAPGVALIEAETHLIDGIATMTKAAPGLRVVVFCRDDNQILLHRALKAGAHGFVVCMGDNIENLFAAVEQARRGEHTVCPSSLKHLIDTFTRQAPAHLETFTPRESAVLTLVAEGRSNDDIGKQLHVSRGTVKNHVTGILRKLNVRSRAAAVARIA